MGNTPATKRRGTTKYSMPLADFLQVKATFLQEIIDVVKMEDVPAELMINWDQTGLNLVPAPSWSMAAKGSKCVELKGQNNKQQINTVFWNSCRFN